MMWPPGTRALGRSVEAKEYFVAEKSDDATVAKANLVEHLKNINICV